MYGRLIPQLWNAEPKATVPFSILTCHNSLNSSGATFRIILLTSAMYLMNLSCICSGVNFNSLINRSVLLINKTGRTLSFKACLNTVSV